MTMCPRGTNLKCKDFPAEGQTGKGRRERDGLRAPLGELCSASDQLRIALYLVALSCTPVRRPAGSYCSDRELGLITGYRSG
jgi:hypothetical protein